MATLSTYRPSSRSRASAAAVTLMIECLVAVALLTGTTTALHQSSDTLKLFEVNPPVAEPERVLRRPAKSHRPAGEASPPNLRSRATEIVAPRPIVALIVPPPIAAAPLVATGRDLSSGAADITGPGTGAGGRGNGTGSGGEGYGDGDGGGETAPRWRKGRLKDSDYPRVAGEMGVGGTVSVKYMVGTDGRVSNCQITRSSGNRELDQTTCQLIAQRFRFDPSRDAAGRAIPSYLRENHSWAIRQDPLADDRE